MQAARTFLIAALYAHLYFGLPIAHSISDPLWQRYSVQVEAPAQDVSQLPAPKQSQNTVLVYNSAGTRTSFVARQLHQYVNLCEVGFEVHVVLATTLTSWKTTQALRPSWFTCNRLGADLPVVLASFKPEIGKRMQAMYRILWKHYASVYDYFIFQEDDILIKPHNIKYAIEWTDRLKDLPGNYKPTWNAYEVPVHEVNGTELWHQVPNFLFHAMSTVDLMKSRHDLLFTFNFPYCAAFLLTQQEVLSMTASPLWIEEVHTRWDMENEHFAYWWFAVWNITMVTPLTALHSSLVHHSKNNYIRNPGELDGRRNGWNRLMRKAGVEAKELAHMLSVCAGQSADKRITFSSASIAPCHTCFQRNMVAHLSPNFTWEYPARHVKVAVSCQSSLEPGIRATPCANQSHDNHGYWGCFDLPKQT
jgi:hypothetical protein